MIVRVRALLFLLPVVAFLAGACMMGRQDAVAATLIVAGMALYLLLYLLIRCPSCDKSPMVRVNQKLGLITTFSSPIPERTCSKCGFQFSSESASAD